MARAYLYHWTPALNVPSICAGGLDPSYATGKRKVSWMCSSRRLMWALLHASMHQSCSPDEMRLLRIDVTGQKLGRTPWRGVRTSAVTIDPRRITVVRVAYTVVRRGCSKGSAKK